MFEPYSDTDTPANAFRYRGVPVRFTYRVEIGSESVGQIDIDGVMPEDEGETRWHRLSGPWQSREAALAAAQKWAAAYIDQVLDENQTAG